MIDLTEKLKGYRFDLTGYTLQCTGQETITWEDARQCFQLSPKPERLPAPGDYIARAQETGLLDYVFFYLHHSEGYINQRIQAYAPEADSDPLCLMELKHTWRDVVLEHFTDYDLSLGVGFNAFIDRFVRDAIHTAALQREAWTLDSLDSYKKLRRVAAIRSTADNYENAVKACMQQLSCSEKNAQKLLQGAAGFRSRVLTPQEDPEAFDDELFSDHFDYVDTLWNGMQAAAIDKAFDKLRYRDQDLLEKRNAICMNCGRVSPLSRRMTFEELARRYELSGTAGAEKAYAKACERLMVELCKAGVLFCVRVRQLSVRRESQKETGAVYAYQVNNAGTWGEIVFDFVNGTEEVTVFAGNDPADTWAVTDAAIACVKGAKGLPKTGMTVVRMCE